MLILVGRDGNNSNVIMAVALCPTENAENYAWFLQQCVNGGISFENLLLFCDRGGGILSAAGQLGIRSLVHCTRHLIGNMKDRFKATFSIDLQNLVWRAQGVDTAQEFNSVLETLQLSHSGAYGYLSAIDPSLWTVHANVGKLALFGWRTTNFVESENSTALSKRKLAPFNFFLTAMEDHMTALYNNKLKYKKWKEMKLLVTSFAQEKLVGERDQLGFYDVMPSSTNVAYVWDL